MQRLAVRIARWLHNRQPSDEEIEVVTVVPMNKRGQILLVRRSKTEETRPGEWEGVGGHVDPGETITETAKREAQEEIGVEILLLPGREYFTLREGGYGVMLRGLILDEEIELNPEEHDKYIWLDPSELRKVKKVPPDFHDEVEALLKKNSKKKIRVVS